MSDFVEISPDERFSLPLVLHFEGDIPRAGLDADEVAAVADGMAKAIQFLVSQSNDNERQYTLHLTAARPGSATFQFLMEGAALIQSVFPVIFPGGFTVREAATVFTDAIKVLQFLRGAPPAKVINVNVSGKNNIVLFDSNGNNFTTTKNKYELAANPYFQDQLAKSTKPLKKSGRKLTVSEGKEKILESSSENYSAIAKRLPNSAALLTSQTIEATLRVTQPHLDGEQSWKFQWGRNRITAEVTDISFMAKVNAREEEFRAGDLVRVKLRIEERRDGKNVTKRHFVDEVIRREAA